MTLKQEVVNANQGIHLNQNKEEEREAKLNKYM